MFHMSACTLALGVGSDFDMPVVSDDIIPSTNSHLFLQQPMDLIAALVFSPLMDRAKLTSPTLRQIAPPYLRPVFNGTTPPTNYNAGLFDDNPVRLPAFEEIQVLATSTIGASTERANALLVLRQVDEPIPPGGWTPLRFTATGTAVANAWTTLTTTFADSIPSGTYTMCISECFGTTQVAHRWVVSNQYWRPGFPSFTTAIMRHPYAVSKGQWGKMGSFKNTDLPRLQVLCNSADTAYTGYLSVIKTG